jgi:hypothetical protein
MFPATPQTAEAVCDLRQSPESTPRLIAMFKKQPDTETTI